MEGRHIQMELGLPGAGDWRLRGYDHRRVFDIRNKFRHGSTVFLRDLDLPFRAVCASWDLDPFPTQGERLYQTDVPDHGRFFMLVGGVFAIAQLGFIIGLSMIGSAVAIIAFNFLMRAPTETGRRLIDHIEGFQAYLGACFL